MKSAGQTDHIDKEAHRSCRCYFSEHLCPAVQAGTGFSLAQIHAQISVHSLYSLLIQISEKTEKQG
jgi:hypothetical protein